MGLAAFNRVRRLQTLASELEDTKDADAVLETRTVTELKEIADSLGLTYGAKIKKQELINLIQSPDEDVIESEEVKHDETTTDEDVIESEEEAELNK